MPIRALLIANAVMVLFLTLVAVQSFNGLNASGLADKMYSYELIKTAS